MRWSWLAIVVVLLLSLFVVGPIVAVFTSDFLDGFLSTTITDHVEPPQTHQVRTKSRQPATHGVDAENSTPATSGTKASQEERPAGKQAEAERSLPSVQKPRLPVAGFDPTGGFRFFHCDGDNLRIVYSPGSLDAKRWGARIVSPLTQETVETPTEHQAFIVHAGFSRDGRLIVTASMDNTARIWDAATGKAMGPPLQHQAEVRHAAFSADGRMVVTASQDETAQLWEVASGRPIGTAFQHSWGLFHAAFSPDDRLVVTAGVRAVIWDVASAKKVHELPIGGCPHAAFSPDARCVITAGYDKSARVWDVVSGNPVGLPLKHEEPHWRAAFSPDGMKVVTCSEEVVRVWDAATGEPISTLLVPSASSKEKSRLLHACFSPDSKTIVTADGDAHVWDAVSGMRIGPVHGLRGLASYAAFSPDGRHILTDAPSITNSRTGEVLPKQAQPTTRRDEKNKPSPPAGTSTGSAPARPAEFDLTGGFRFFHGDGDEFRTLSFATVETNQGRRVHFAQILRPMREKQASGSTLTHRDYLRHAAFSPDGKLLVTTSDDGTAQLWDASTELPHGPPLRHLKNVGHAAFSPDSRFVVTASDDGTARIWDVWSGEPIGSPLKHEQGVRHAAFDPTGQRIVTASDDGTARIWNATSGNPLGAPLKVGFGRVVHAIFSPDGRRLVTSTDNDGSRLWDAATGEPIGSPMEATRGVNHACFSRDSRFVVTCGTNGTARIWDASTGRSVGQPIDHLFPRDRFGVTGPTGVLHAAFSPDGRMLITAGSEKTARVWEAATGKQVGTSLKHSGSGEIHLVAFSQTGDRILTAGWGLVRVWDTLTKQQVAEASVRLRSE
jgi:WD40 repeat protein